MFCSCWSVGALGPIIRLALPNGLQAALCVLPCVCPGLLVFAPLSSFSTGAAVPVSRYWYLSAGSNPGTGTCQLVRIQAGTCQLFQIQAGTCQLVQIQAGTGAAAEAVRPALHVTAQGSQARSPGPPEAFSYASEILLVINLLKFSQFLS